MRPQSNPLHSAFSAVVALSIAAILIEGHYFMTRTFCVIFALFMWLAGVLMSRTIYRMGREIQRQFFKRPIQPSTIEEKEKEKS